jgi:hypothetical protein
MRFLVGVTVAWTMARGVTLVGWSPSSTDTAARHGGMVQDDRAHFPALVQPSHPIVPMLLRTAFVTPYGVPARGTPLRASGNVPPAPAARDPGGASMLLVADADGGGPYRRDSGLAEAAVAVGPAPSSKRWSGSAWAFLRGGGRATTLSPGGQIGGGQAGARVLYRLDRDGHLAAAARISTAIGGARQTEAAVGLDWKPIASLPVHLMAERRIAIDRGGRNAFTLGAAGGVDDVKIAPGWRLDAYGEAGVVGARRRDLYADGAARVARAIALGGNTSLALGGGAWGAAQPGASRLDVGPSVVLRLPIEHHAVAVALDWRERVLGHARPGSGVALTVATDF